MDTQSTSLAMGLENVTHSDLIMATSTRRIAAGITDAVGVDMLRWSKLQNFHFSIDSNVECFLGQSSFIGRNKNQIHRRQNDNFPTYE